MGKKDSSLGRAPVDQYRKQIGQQDYKKSKSALKNTRLQAEAKKNAPGIKAKPSVRLVAQVERQGSGSVVPLDPTLPPREIWRRGTLFTVLPLEDFTRLSIFMRGRRGERRNTVEDVLLVIVAILFFLLCVYAFFYLNLSTELDLDVDVD